MALTYYAEMFETPSASPLELVLFNIIIALLIGSYVQCLLLDPGTGNASRVLARSLSLVSVSVSVCVSISASASASV